MSRQPERDTAPEAALRGELYRRGHKFTTHVQPVVGLRREADFVFRRERVAVFVDGCFWHGCSAHASWPKRNASYWSDKIEANRVRDADTDSQYAAAGWLVVRAWEHEPVLEVADRIQIALDERRSRS